MQEPTAVSVGELDCRYLHSKDDVGSRRQPQYRPSYSFEAQHSWSGRTNQECFCFDWDNNKSCICTKRCSDGGRGPLANTLPAFSASYHIYEGQRSTPKMHIRPPKNRDRSCSKYPMMKLSLNSLVLSICHCPPIFFFFSFLSLYMIV